MKLFKITTVPNYIYKNEVYYVVAENFGSAAKTYKGQLKGYFDIKSIESVECDGVAVEIKEKENDERTNGKGN